MLTAFCQRKLLLLYMLYACGSALFLTLLFYSLEPSNPPSDEEQSNVRLPICFLNIGTVNENIRMHCII